MALRSISSMTLHLGARYRLWNSIAAGPAGPGARPPAGRACPPPQLPGASPTGPVHRHRGPGPARARLCPRPGSGAPGARGPGRLPPRRGGSYIELSGGAKARVTRARGGWGRRWGAEGQETRGEIGSRRGRFHARYRPPGFGAPGAKQERKLARGGDGCGRGSLGSDLGARGGPAAWTSPPGVCPQFGRPA